MNERVHTHPILPRARPKSVEVFIVEGGDNELAAKLVQDLELRTGVFDRHGAMSKAG